MPKKENYFRFFSFAAAAVLFSWSLMSFCFHINLVDVLCYVFFFCSYSLFNAQCILHYVPHFSIVVNSFVFSFPHALSFPFFLSIFLFFFINIFFVLFFCCLFSESSVNIVILLFYWLLFRLGMHHSKATSNSVNAWEIFIRCSTIFCCLFHCYLSTAVATQLNARWMAIAHLQHSNVLTVPMLIRNVIRSSVFNLMLFLCVCDRCSISELQLEHRKQFCLCILIYKIHNKVVHSITTCTEPMCECMRLCCYSIYLPIVWNVR